MTFRSVSTRPEVRATNQLWVFPRWITRPLAFAITIGVEGGLMWTFLHLADHQVPPRSASDARLIVVPVGPANDTASGQSAAQSRTLPRSIPQTKPETTQPAPIPHEWSTAVLPRSAISTAASETAAGASSSQGSGTSGKATGGGYDPYAFASYELPRWVKGQVASARMTRPGAVEELKQLIRSRTGASGILLKMHLAVGPDGRITSANFVPPLPSHSAAIAQVVIGFPLCTPVPTGGATNSLNLDLPT